MKIKDLKENSKPPHILLYGPAGGGKTALAMQAKNAYMMDFDGGIRTAQTLLDKFYNQRQEIDGEFDPNPFIDGAEAPHAFMKARQKLIEIINAIRKDKWSFKCLISDSLTKLSKSCERQVGHTSGHTKLTLPDWGLVVGELQEYLRLLTTLPILTITIAHVDLYEQDKIMKSRPFCSGRKLPNYLPAIFDELLYCDAKRVGVDSYSYFVSGRKTSCIEARTRSSMKKDYIHAHDPSKPEDEGLMGLLKQMDYNY